MRERDDVIERVRKLLERQVGRGCTEAEAGSAYTMASRLLAQHNITMSEVESSQSEEGDDWVTEDISEAKRVPYWFNAAAGVVSKYFFVKTHIGHRWDRETRKYTVVQQFFGKPTNVETARWVFNSLGVAFDNLWLAYKARTGAGRAAKASFVFGVANGFMARLREERKAMEAERPDAVTGTAIVLVGLDAKLASAYKDAHPDIRAGRGTRTSGDREARDAGYEAGKKLNLARPVGSGSAKKQLPQ